MSDLCERCHWKDKDPKLCHGTEPPMEKPFIPEVGEDCFFLAETYWSRIPEEYRESFMRDVRIRSENR